MTSAALCLALIAQTILGVGAARMQEKANMEDSIATVEISPEALHEDRITRLLYGSFIELLDDHVPGMWAEMLNGNGIETSDGEAQRCG